MSPIAQSAVDTANPHQTNGSQVFREFLKNPNTHPHIPNNTFAGFRHGAYNLFNGKNLIGEAFPDYSIIDLKKNGAKGDGKTDDTKAILDAVENARSGTILYFPEGEYIISDILRITKSNLAFMGDGPAKTTFYFQKSLNDILGPFLKEGTQYYNRWSNHGALIWVAPSNIWGNDQKYVYQKPGQDGLDIGWMNGVTLGKVTRPASRGDDTITVKCKPSTTAAELMDGLLIMNWKNDPQNELLSHFCGHNAFREYAWNKTPKLQRDWEWLCEASQAVSLGDDTWQLTLKQPLRIDIRDIWAVEIRKPEAQVDSERYIENFALQGITLKMKKHEKWQHFHEPGFNGVFFQRSFNCFIHDVDAYNCDNSFTLESSKGIMIRKTRLLGDEKRHHGYYFRYNVHDCIVSDFHVGQCGNEALSISFRSSGNIFHGGTMERGSFDSHRGIPFDLIRSNITLVSNDGNQGGGAEAGPRNGARVVHWNITDRSRNGRTIAEPDCHPSGLLAGIFCNHYLSEREPSMPKGPLNTLTAPLDEQASPLDIYPSMMEAMKKNP